MKTKSKISILAAAIAAGMSLAPAQAQNPNFAPGDLVLFFQQFGGSNTLILNVGAGTLYRDQTTSLINLANVGTELVGAFGVNWFDDSTVYFGIAGVRSASTGTTTHVDGDPNRTLYVSQARGSVGVEGTASSPGWSGFGNGDMTTGANGIIAVHNRLETQSLTDRLAESTADSAVDNQNPFLGSNPGTAFGIFPGGVEAAFGAGSFGTLGGVNAEAAVDLYRILASTSASGQVGGPLREGTYEGSFVVDSSGNISYINVPEPSSAVLMGSAALLGGFIRRRKSLA